MTALTIADPPGNGVPAAKILGMNNHPNTTCGEDDVQIEGAIGSLFGIHAKKYECKKIPEKMGGYCHDAFATTVQILR